MQAKKEFMQKAIDVAKSSAKNGEYAIGAVIVKDGKIIATGEVKRAREENPILHAEIVAIENACKTLGTRSLKGCTLYSTQECCPMCSAAAVWAKMEGIVFGAFSKDVLQKGTDKFSWRQIGITCRDVLEKSYPKMELVEGFMRDECLKLVDLSR